jgi:hypothetical protein
LEIRKLGELTSSLCGGGRVSQVRDALKMSKAKLAKNQYILYPFRNKGDP